MLSVVRDLFLKTLRKSKTVMLIFKGVQGFPPAEPAVLIDEACTVFVMT